MTREEAKEVLIIKAGYGDFVENIIDQIFDEHEALQQHKSCDNCEYESGDNFKTLIECGTDIHICALCKRGTNDYFKPKEQ